MAAFELTSSDGKQRATWSVVDTSATHLKTDIVLSSAMMHARVSLSSMMVDVAELRRLLGALDDWLSLPPDQAAPLQVTASVGGGFDCWLLVRLGQQAESGGERQHTVKIEYEIGCLGGSLDFVTDRSCIRVWRDGVASAIAGTTSPKPGGAD